MRGFAKLISSILLPLALPRPGFVSLGLRRRRRNKRISSTTNFFAFTFLGWILAGAIVVEWAEPAAAALDLKLVSLTKRSSDPNIEQVAIVDKRAAFTFSVKTENAGDKYIPWGFPMYEDFATPWVVANKGQKIYPPVNGAGMPTVESPRGFSGITEQIDTPHTLPMPDPPPGPGPGAFPDPMNPMMDPNDPTMEAFPLNRHFVGSHPHLQLTLWAQPAGSGGAWERIGCSDLKHAFSTVYPFPPPDQADGGDDYPAFSSPSPGVGKPGEIDDYGNNSDRDRDFYGPMSEMDPTTFVVAKHLHLADADHGDATRNFRGTDANGYNVYERGHGQQDHKGVGQEIDHLLQADVLSLLDSTQQFNGMDGRYNVNTRWYAAATWYVVGDTTPNNNTVYRRFNPGWDGTKFVPSWNGASFDGRFNDAPALFLAPCMEGGAFVAEPGSLSLLLLGGLSLLRRRRSIKGVGA